MTAATAPPAGASVRPPDRIVVGAGAPPRPPADRRPVVPALAFAAGIVILALEGRGLWFTTDEWGLLLDRRTVDAATLLAPHNEHWVTGTTLLYRPLFVLAGFGTHLPYHLAGVALHAASVAAVWFVLRRLAVPAAVACLTALVLLLPATAPEQVFSPLALSWTPSVLLALAATVLLRRQAGTAGRSLRRRQLCAALLLLLAQPFGGVGLAAALGLGAALCVQRRWRTALGVAGPAVAAYAAWRATAGAATATPLEGIAVAAVPAYVVTGVRASVARLSGLAQPWADVALVAGAAVVAVGVVRRRLDLVGLAGACSALAFLVLAGLARVEAGGIEQAATDRYLHLVGMWLALAVAAAVPRRAWRGVVPAAAAIALVPVLVVNVAAAHRGFEARRRTTASVEARLVAADLLLAEGLPAVSDAQPEPLLAPDVTARRLTELRRDGIALGRRGLEVGPAQRAAAALQLQLAFTRDRPPSAPVVVSSADGPLTPDSPGCLRATLPPGGAVVLDAQPGALRLLPPDGGLRATRADAPDMVVARTESGRALALEVAVPTAVRLSSVGGGELVVCGTR